MKLVLIMNEKIMLIAIFLIFDLILCGCTGITGSANGSSPGSGAQDFLTANSYSSLVIEIQAVTGYQPSSTSQTNLVNFLSARLNKPAGITVQIDPDITSPGQTSYSLADVDSIESKNRKLQSSGNKAVAYFLFLDGPSTSDSGNGQILGQAHGPSSIVIYEKSIKGLSGSIGQPSTAVLESTVLEHEFGHLLGLTNIGSNMQTPHQDTAHGAHCNETTCLMYWNVDTSNIVGNLLGGTIPALDANCLADLKAAGGK